MAEYELQSSSRKRESDVWGSGVVGDWTPALTFTSPGDLSVAYNHQLGRYVRSLNEVRVSFFIDTSTFTHSSATGICLLTGLPFVARSHPTNLWFSFGAMTAYQGLSAANYTQLAPFVRQATQYIEFGWSAQGQTAAFLAPSHMASGNSIVFNGSVIYEI